MRPITVTVGPLVAATATKVATAQRNYGAGGALALIGAASDAVATTVCASQSPGSAALTINGTRSNTGVAYIPGADQIGQYIYITCAGDNHAVTFAVVGTSFPNGIVVTENITGTNAQSSASVNRYTTILSITPSGAVTGAVTVGSFTKATLDTPRRLLFTTTADESANVATIVGTTFGGAPATETLTLVNNSTTYSVLDYATVRKITLSAAAAGNISVGTNGIASSAWVALDPWAASYVAIQLTVSGTVNYTLQQTMDDPNSPTNPVAIGSVTWLSTSDTAAVAATTSVQTNYAFVPAFTRILLNSNTNPGFVTGTFAQSGVVNV